MKQALATAQAPAAIGPYSQGIAAGQTVYVSGQLPIDPATGAIPEGIAAQTAQSLKNIQAILAGGETAERRTAGDRMHRREVTEHPIRERDGATLWNRTCSFAS